MTETALVIQSALIGDLRKIESDNNIESSTFDFYLIIISLNKIKFAGSFVQNGCEKISRSDFALLIWLPKLLLVDLFYESPPVAYALLSLLREKKAYAEESL